MKKTRVMVLFIMVCMVLTATVAAEPFIGGSLEKLTRMTLISAESPVNDEVTVTRAEFVSLLCKLAGFKGLVGSIAATDFSDIAFDDAAAACIRYATDLGIIDGYGNGTFGAQDKITYEQAVKMLVCAFGYQEMAESAGGYPNGYLTIAQQMQIADVPVEQAQETMTWNQASELLLNAVSQTAELTNVIFETFETDETFSVKAFIEGEWKAADGTYNLALASGGTNQPLGCISVHQTPIMGDFVAQVDINIVETSGVWQDAALIFDWADENNYKFVSIAESNDGGVHGIFEVQDGRINEVMDFSSEDLVRPGIDCTITLVRRGNLVCAYYTGVLQGEPDYSVKQYLLGAVFMNGSKAGYIGVGSKNDSASFDNFSVNGTEYANQTTGSVPVILSTTATDPERVELAWRGSDNAATVRYNIMRNGQLIASTSALKFTDNTVKPNSVYHYSVQAQALNSVASEESNSVIVETPNVSENADKLTWMPPTLENPETIYITDENATINLESGKDYILKMEETVHNAVKIQGNGARNIVWIGGDIEISDKGPWPFGDAIEDEEAKDNEAFFNTRRGLYLTDWTGVFHIEGIWIHGSDLGEGVDIDTRHPGATLQMQNVRFEECKGRPEESKNYTGKHIMHPDVMQNWGGPTYYRIDRLTGYPHYQGFMMQPIQFDENMNTVVADFRNINLVKTGSSGYMFYMSSGTDNMLLTNVYCKSYQDGANIAYPVSDPLWNAIRQGVPDDGDFVKGSNEGGVGIAGLHYISPGYLETDSGVLLNESSIALYDLNTTKQLLGTSILDGDDRNVEWSSSNPSVATVSEVGLVTAVGFGTATITAKSGGEKAATESCTVTVAGRPEQITAAEKEITLHVGETVAASAVVSGNGHIAQGTSWISENPEIATITNDGEITAVAAGTATIRVISEADAALYDTVSVTVE